MTPEPRDLPVDPLTPSDWFLPDPPTRRYRLVAVVLCALSAALVVGFFGWAVARIVEWVLVAP